MWQIQSRQKFNANHLSRSFLRGRWPSSLLLNADTMLPQTTILILSTGIDAFFKVSDRNVSQKLFASSSCLFSFCPSWSRNLMYIYECVANFISLSGDLTRSKSKLYIGFNFTHTLISDQGVSEINDQWSPLKHLDRLLKERQEGIWDRSTSHKLTALDSIV